MPMLRRDPFTALARLDQEFDEVVRRTFGATPYQWVPPVEMATEGADVVITLEIPGVDVSDVDIEVSDGRLTISGERRDTWEDSRGKIAIRSGQHSPTGKSGRPKTIDGQSTEVTTK